METPMKPRIRIRTLPAASFIVVAAAIAALAMATAGNAAWVDPTDLAPPGGNVSAPLNVSSVSQTKSGALTLGGALTMQNNIFVQTDERGIFWATTADDAQPHIERKGNRLFISPGNGVGSQIRLQKDTFVEGTSTLTLEGGELCFGVGNCSNTWGTIGNAVTSVNTIDGAVTIEGGGDVTVADDVPGKKITISCIGCAGGGSTLWEEDTNYLHPLNTSNAGLFFGGTDPGNAKYSFDLNTSGLPLAQFASRLSISANSDTAGQPLVLLNHSGSDSTQSTLLVSGDQASDGAPTLNIRGPGRNGYFAGSRAPLYVSNMGSGIAAIVDGDARVLSGDLKVGGFEGSNVFYGIRLKAGDKADVESFCTTDPNDPGDCTAKDALYIQNNSQDVYFSPDSAGPTDGHIGIGTTGIADSYKLTIDRGSLDKTVLIRGGVDIESSGLTAPGQLTTEDDIISGGQICIDDVCMTKQNLIDLLASLP